MGGGGGGGGGGVEGSHFLSVCDVIVGRFPGIPPKALPLNQGSHC